MPSSHEKEDKIRHWLAKALVLVENGEKRLPSLVVEHFFETSLLPYLVKERKPMTGWFRFGIGHEKLWGYISRGAPSEEVVDTARILLDTREIDDIYFFTYSVEEKESNGKISVDFSMQVGNFRSDRRGWSRFLNRSVSCSTGLLDIVNMLPEKTTGPTQWFPRHFDIETLERLVITRLVMNHALCGMWPIDIDGLFLNNGVLHFIEFKRKDPARGYFLFDRKIENVHDAIEECRSLAREIQKKIDSNTSIARFLEESGRKKVDEPVFGLDTSHLQTLSLCKSKNFVYDYVIWEEKMKGETDTGTFIEHINRLFPENEKKGKLVPEPPFRFLKSRLSNLQPMYGFLYTIGKDSSGLNGAGRGKQSVRVQVAVPKKEGFDILYKR